jgi:hypothetical protein
VMKMALLSKLKLTTAVGLCVLAAGVFGVGLLPGPTPLPVAHAAPVPKDDKLTPEKQAELDRLYNNLGSNHSQSIQAALAFAGQPGATVAYLKQKMRPVKLDEKTAKGLIAKLLAADEKEWPAALSELQYFDPRLVMTVPEIWAEAKTDDERARVVAVVCYESADLHSYTYKLRDTTKDNGMFAIDATTKPGVKLPRFGGRENVNLVMSAVAKVEQLRKWSCEENALVILEHIGTPEAVKIIEDMATGHPEAAPTKVAKEVLGGLKKK